MEKVRLQKLIAESGLCSRRKAEELITAGKVKVNGHVAKIGDGAAPDDVIHVNGERLSSGKKKSLYILLNKPRGYVTTMSDELDRRCVTELLKGVRDRVYPVGRLDKNSEGALLFTNDGAFANMIMHPAGSVSKTYRVTVRSGVNDEQLVTMSSPIEIDGRMTSPASVEVVEDAEPGRAVLRVVVNEGRNKQVRRLCEAAGLEVARLRRVAVGPVKLGMLKPGAYRELTREEVRALKAAAEKSDKRA